MTNAFVAALLKVAAEERAVAESDRNCMLLDPRTVTGRWMNEALEKRARECEGRAEVYEAFAHRLIGDITGELISAKFEELTGEASLDFSDSPVPYRFEFQPNNFVQGYWQRWLLKGLVTPPPSSLIITTTN